MDRPGQATNAEEGEGGTFSHCWALPPPCPCNAQVSDGIVDARDEVKEAAVAAAESAFALAGNRDIAPCVPSFLTCIRNPKETAEAILKLSGTTFVQAVEVRGRVTA